MMVALLLSTLHGLAGSGHEDGGAEEEHKDGEVGGDPCPPLPSLLPVGSDGLLPAEDEVDSELCPPLPGLQKLQQSFTLYIALALCFAKI